MPARLILHYPQRPAARVFLQENQRYVLGRGTDCDVVLEDQRVSRRHGALHREKDHWVLAHLGSKNGLTVGGEPWETGALPANAWISFGGLLGEFEVLSREAFERDEQQALSRWQTSLQLQTKLDPSIGLEKLLQRTLASVLEISGAERGFVLLVRSDGELELSTSTGVEAQELEEPAFSGSLGAIERALAQGTPVTLADVRQDAELAQRQSVLMTGTRALLCLPLIVLDRTVGVVYADSRKIGSTFTELDVELLTALSSHAALALAMARIHEEVEELDEALPGRVRGASGSIVVHKVRANPDKDRSQHLRRDFP